MYFTLLPTIFQNPPQFLDLFPSFRQALVSVSISAETGLLLQVDNPSLSTFIRGPSTNSVGYVLFSLGLFLLLSIGPLARLEQILLQCFTLGGCLTLAKSTNEGIFSRDLNLQVSRSAFSYELRGMLGPHYTHYCWSS